MMTSLNHNAYFKKEKFRSDVFGYESENKYKIIHDSFYNFCDRDQT